MSDGPAHETARHPFSGKVALVIGGSRDGMNVHYTLTNAKVLAALDLLRQVLNENLSRSAKLAKVIA